MKSRFPSEIRLFTACNSNGVVGGCLVFETSRVAHIQYISANEEGRQSGALDLIFDYLINNTFKNKKYFDFGISTENGGDILNTGLISQKEGFGGRGIAYDIYKINIK